MRTEHQGPSPFRSPVRISITIPDSVHEGLAQIANEQGRSLSNLAAYLLEWALSEEQNCQLILHRTSSEGHPSSAGVPMLNHPSAPDQVGCSDREQTTGSRPGS
ncbi:hypothetical protein KQ304_08470 [Synechococcus sp. CS-1329]|uniref:ribbon-helix-helix domain-containing protein n=1 Tax=Synechococcus sp. CS-1329 TaxID=2847975 RepID=UPI00223B80F1|nr:hypothetical protein [Synechococcus sp. CS-1329]MCT0219030.1 hypothetical protein [Synechococcus sp. CS-1329]